MIKSLRFSVSPFIKTAMTCQLQSLLSARSRLSLTQQHICPNRLISSSSSLKIEFRDQGTKFTGDYKKYAVSDNQVMSYFHDVPLDLDLESKTANMIVEIPRWTNAKFEIDTKAVGNPIVQDTKKGQVRFVKNLFPHHGYIHNYGAFPQTWEDPNTAHEELGDIFGDNDPLDVCEIGSNIIQTGEVKKVKILGSIALIDDGELDWKVIVVDVHDPLSNEVLDIHDVFVKCPGLLETTRQWFRDYKKPDGKPANKFAFNGAYKNQEETLAIIQECNRAWGKLISGEVKGDGLPVIENSTISQLPGFLESGFNTAKLLNNPVQPDAPIPSEIHKPYFCTTD